MAQADPGRLNMDLFDNPLLLSNQVRELELAVTRWRERLRIGDIDETGPFIGRPILTERDAFRVIRELRQPDPIKVAYLRWAYRFSEARVNAPVQAAMAEAYRLTRHQLEFPEPLDLTLAELIQRAMSRPKERLVWIDALAASASWLQRLSVEWLARQDEIAKRAGFADADEPTVPTKDLTSLVERMLTATDDCYGELAPKELDRWLDAALGLNATRGWPAQLNARTVQALLGSPGWLDGLDLASRALPQPIAATSFARGLYELGAAIAQAAVPRQDLFALAHDPYDLHRHTLGAMLASLTASAAWQKHTLLLSTGPSQEQARALQLARLIHARTGALAWLTRDAARHGLRAMGRQFEELCHRTIGLTLPPGLALVLPRLHVDQGQRLAGVWLAARWTEELTANFDEDWFRNPRGIEAVRSRLAQGFPTEVASNELAPCVDVFASSLRQSL